LSTIDKHYALIITSLFDTQAAVRFGIHVPSSGSFPDGGTWMPKHVGACVSNKEVIISA
jgi:hypothetical protein